MERIIKFRGQRCSLRYEGQERWVYGYLVQSSMSWKNHKPHKSWIVDNAMTNGGWFSIMGKTAVKDETVGQFTGLVDKNGKEIYEGDILRYESGLLVEVRCFHGGFGYSGLFGDILFGGNGNFKFNPADTDERFEIAGNIHDNPELLKGGEK